jgi:hypothetical protein
MEMTCIDCVSWWQFFFVSAVAAMFILAGTFSFRVLKPRNRTIASIALTLFSIPALWFLVRAYRLLFGPNWHGTLLR